MTGQKKLLGIGDAGAMSAGNTDLWQEICMIYIIVYILCIKFHSFQSNVPCTACYKIYLHFQRVDQCESHAKMYNFLTGNSLNYHMSPGSHGEKNTLPFPIRVY